MSGRGGAELGGNGDGWEHEDDDAEGRGANDANDFPPGEHPLEGVPNLEELPDPEALSAKIDLSEVGEAKLRA